MAKHRSTDPVKVYEGRLVTNFDVPSSTREWQDLEFHRSVFDKIFFIVEDLVSDRTMIRDSRFSYSVVTGDTQIDDLVLDNVVIDGLKSGDDATIRIGGSVVFNHVKLRGIVDPVVTLSAGSGLRIDSTKFVRQRAIHESNVEFYKSVDWALDISEAQFNGPAIFREIPAQLMVRNPLSQVLVLREDAEKVDLDAIGFGASGWDNAIRNMVRSSSDSIVLAAPTRGDKVHAYQRLLSRMRESGLAAADSKGLVYKPRMTAPGGEDENAFPVVVRKADQRPAAIRSRVTNQDGTEAPVGRTAQRSPRNQPRAGQSGSRVTASRGYAPAPVSTEHELAQSPVRRRSRTADEQANEPTVVSTAENVPVHEPQAKLTAVRSNVNRGPSRGMSR